VSVETEGSEQALLEPAHVGEARGGGKLLLASAAREYHQRFLDACEFFPQAVDAERFAFPSFPLQQGSQQ